MPIFILSLSYTCFWAGEYLYQDPEIYLQCLRVFFMVSVKEVATLISFPVAFYICLTTFWESALPADIPPLFEMLWSDFEL